MGEPLLLTVGVMLLWSATKEGHSTGGIGVVPFILTGYTMLTLWRHTTGRAVLAFRGNAGLLFHRGIYFTDIIVSKVLLEIVAIGAAFFVAYLPLYLLGYLEPIHDPLTLVGAWLLMGWLCFGVALIIAAVTEMFEPAEHFVQPIMYMTLPICGVFFMVEWLPLKHQKLIALVPLVHFFEMFRHGLYGDKILTHWNVTYMIAWCIPITAVGFYLCNAARARIRFE